MALKNSGGIWIRSGKKGKFMSGVFEPQGKDGPKYKFMAFKNDDKGENDKKPDYRIVVSDDEDDQKAPSKGYDERPAQQPIEDDDSVPF